MRPTRVVVVDQAQIGRLASARVANWRRSASSRRSVAQYVSATAQSQQIPVRVIPLPVVVHMRRRGGWRGADTS